MHYLLVVESISGSGCGSGKATIGIASVLERLVSTLTVAELIEEEGQILAIGSLELVSSMLERFHGLVKRNIPASLHDYLLVESFFDSS